jgi:hypothetical protein
MAKRSSLGALVLSTLAIAAAYGSAFLPGDPPAWGAWLMALGIATMMVACMALGASRTRGVGRLKIPFALTFLILAGGFCAVMLLPEEGPGAPLYFGLPLRAAVVLLGVGLLPLLVLPLAYALTFDEMTLSEEDLERVRAAARQLRAAPASVPTLPAAAEVETV